MQPTDRRRVQNGIWSGWGKLEEGYWRRNLVGQRIWEGPKGGMKLVLPFEGGSFMGDRNQAQSILNQRLNADGTIREDSDIYRKLHLVGSYKPDFRFTIRSFRSYYINEHLETYTD